MLLKSLYAEGQHTAQIRHHHDGNGFFIQVSHTNSPNPSTYGTYYKSNIENFHRKKAELDAQPNVTWIEKIQIGKEPSLRGNHRGW